MKARLALALLMAGAACGAEAPAPPGGGPSAGAGGPSVEAPGSSAADAGAPGGEASGRQASAATDDGPGLLEAMGHVTGDPDAPLQVVEFSDFACGYCRQFDLETWPTLRAEYVETGKVRWRYVPIALGMFGPNATDAAYAGECALEQDRFPAVRRALFERQSEWKRARDAIALFRDYVGELGLDVERWRACMGEGRRRERVARATRLSREIGVRGTPTFFILGYGAIPGAVPIELFRQVLDQAYADRVGNRGG